MYNLVKMDVYRLLRGKSFFVMIIITAFVAVFSVNMTKWSLDLLEREKDTTAHSQTILSANEEDFAFGVHVETKAEWKDTIDFAEYVNGDLSSRMVLILCIIFSAVFVNAEQKNGFLKNIAGQLPNRGYLVFSKLVAISLQVFSILFVYLVSAAVAALCIWKEQMVFSSFLELAKVFGIHYFLHLSFSMMIAALTIFLRSSGFSMTFGLLASTGVTGLLYSFINTLISRVGITKDFDIGSYTLEQCMTMLAKEPSATEMIKIMGVAMVFFLGSVFLSVFVLQKRDIS